MKKVLTTISATAFVVAFSVAQLSTADAQVSPSNPSYNSLKARLEECALRGLSDMTEFSAQTKREIAEGTATITLEINSEEFIRQDLRKSGCGIGDECGIDVDGEVFGGCGHKPPRRF